MCLCVYCPSSWAEGAHAHFHCFSCPLKGDGGCRGALSNEALPYHTCIARAWVLRDSWRGTHLHFHRHLILHCVIHACLSVSHSEGRIQTSTDHPIVLCCVCLFYVWHTWYQNIHLIFDLIITIINIILFLVANHACAHTLRMCVCA